MQLVCLNKDSFVRRYENIGYLYNQLTRKDLIFDDIGAEFLLIIKRYPVSIDKIVKEIILKFPVASEQELKSDFIKFVTELEREGFVSTGQDKESLNEKDVSFSYNNYNSLGLNNEYRHNKIRDSKDYMNSHFKKFPRPFRAQVELVKQCNLKCIHCYLLPDNKKIELSKKTIFAFLDQLEEMGALELIFTGGEPLLHDDLISILLYAREKDFSIILLTNGTLLNDEVIKTLNQINVAFVQISLYSMEPAVHDKITGVTGSWQKTKKSIDTLVRNNIRVEIACPIIKENTASFQQVIEYGNGIGISVSNDLAIMARENFSRDNINHRVDIADIQSIVNCRNQKGMTQKTNKNISKKHHPNDPVCGMGLSLICLSANGDFYPCPGFNMVLGSIYKNKLIDVWETSPKIISLRKVTYASFATCMECDSLNYCTICPAKFYNESRGDIFKIDEYFCEIAKAENKFFNQEA